MIQTCGFLYPNTLGWFYTELSGRLGSSLLLHSSVNASWLFILTKEGGEGLSLGTESVCLLTAPGPSNKLRFTLTWKGILKSVDLPGASYLTSEPVFVFIID